MAIHPNHPGLKAEVVVDYQPLKEYDEDSNGDEKMVVKYLQVDDDSKFAIRYKIPKGLSGEAGVRVKLKIDGKTVASQTQPPDQILHRDCTRHIKTTSSNVNGRKYTQDFRFSQLSIDEHEDDVNEKTSQRLKYIGTITVIFTFIDGKTTRNLRRTARAQPAKAVSPDLPEPDVKEKLPLLGVVSEKSLKGDARSHQASLGAPNFRGVYKPSSAANSYKMGENFAIFQFKYRSLAALRALCVLPQAPSPSSLSPDQPESKTTVTKQQQENNTQTPTIKPEVAPSVKREAPVNVSDDEVEFVGSKRLKSVPTHKDDVIVLD